MDRFNESPIRREPQKLDPIDAYKQLRDLELEQREEVNKDDGQEDTGVHGRASKEST
ncbi:MAG: hypothetical protein J7559_02925 [Cohnella sp.]|nr:hypothetical protein [Cohnella sp.]